MERDFEIRDRARSELFAILQQCQTIGQVVGVRLGCPSRGGKEIAGDENHAAEDHPGPL